MLIQRRLPRHKRNLLDIRRMRVTTRDKPGDYVILRDKSERNSFMESVRNAGKAPKTERQADGSYKCWILENTP